MIRRLLGVTAAFALLVTAAACDSPTDPEDHAVGVVIVDSSGDEVATHSNLGTRTGSIRVALGAEETFRIRLVTENGGQFAPDGDEYSIVDLRSIIAHQAPVAMVGTDRFTVTGVGAVETTLGFEVRHGGHAEFQVSDIPLIVEGVTF